MAYKNHILNIFFSLCFCIAHSQEVILCDMQSLIMKIENSADVPLMTSNDDGTISLSFEEEYITNIFADYDIYDFYQNFPNSSSDEVLKYYTISVNSRAIIESTRTQIPTTILEIFIENSDTGNLPISTSISPEIFQTLDGITYEVTKYISTSDADPCYSCPLLDVPESFNFRVNFNYNATEDILLMESYEPSSCGHSISIGLKGGNPNGFGNLENTLQLWESEPGISPEVDYSQTCHGIEFIIFSILDIACYGYNYDNINVSFDIANETVQFNRVNAIFGYDTIEFSKVNLSINDENFSHMRLYKSSDNPYLQISNLNDQHVSIEIFSALGQHIFSVNEFKNNSVDLSNYETGLYFIKLSNVNNQHKTFKLLLN